MFRCLGRLARRRESGRLANERAAARSPSRTSYAEGAIQFGELLDELKLLDPDGRIEQHRNLFCGHYETCLDEAVNNRWISWTCGRCVRLSQSGGGHPRVVAVARDPPHRA
jgi:hypothetical protein